MAPSACNETDKNLAIPSTPIDIAERRYRDFRPSHATQSTVDIDVYRPVHKSPTVTSDNRVISRRSQISQAYPESSVSFRSTNRPLALPAPEPTAKMGYYDETGRYHSFRAGLKQAVAGLTGPTEETVVRETIIERPVTAATNPNTVTIPCHHIRLGDFLMLQGRPCQVIKITTSPSTGQYRYLGVDLFTKQLHEESSFVSHPAPSVVVQTMLGPVFKVYRVLDIQDGEITAMTETGDIKQGLPVIDQSNLYGRLRKAFAAGAGSVRVMVLNDEGNELAVDMKVVGGARL